MKESSVESYQGRKVKVQLVGTDGNIFALGGLVGSAMRRQGFSREEINAMYRRVKDSQSYHEALGVLLEYADEPDDEDDDDEWDESDGSLP